MTNASALRKGLLASMAAFAACGGAAGSSGAIDPPATTPAPTPAPMPDPGPPPLVPPVDKGIGHVFVIVMENHNWVDIKGSASAPYVNGTLLPLGSHAENYNNPPGLHPSLPNYLWLEAGTNFGITDDNDPATNHQNTTNHFVAMLEHAGISWKSYQEGISGTYVPLTSTNGYAPRHNPFVYFDDVTGTNNKFYPYGVAHIRPYEELSRDLTNHSVARYNF